MLSLANFTSVLEVSFALSAIAAYISSSFINYARSYGKKWKTHYQTFNLESIGNESLRKLLSETQQPRIYSSTVQKLLYSLIVIIYMNTLVSITLLLLAGLFPDTEIPFWVASSLMPYLLYTPIAFVLLYKFVIETLCERALSGLDDAIDDYMKMEMAKAYEDVKNDAAKIGALARPKHSS